MYKICPKCKRSTIEYDYKKEIFRCYAHDCSWMGKDEEMLNVKFDDAAADKTIYAWVNGTKPSPTL